MCKATSKNAKPNKFLNSTLIYSNLDPLTETYGLPFYMQYLAHWPEYFQVAESPSGEIMGYSKRSPFILHPRMSAKFFCLL